MSGPLIVMSLAIHSETIGFDYIFSWSLVIQIFAIYVGFSRFNLLFGVRCTSMESIDFGRKGEILYNFSD